MHMNSSNNLLILSDWGMSKILYLLCSKSDFKAKIKWSQIKLLLQECWYYSFLKSFTNFWMWREPMSKISHDNTKISFWFFTGTVKNFLTDLTLPFPRLSKISSWWNLSFSGQRTYVYKEYTVRGHFVVIKCLTRCWERV